MSVYEAKQPSVRILEWDLGNLSSVPCSCRKFSQYHQGAHHGVVLSLLLALRNLCFKVFGRDLSVVNIISFSAWTNTQFHISSCPLNGKVILTWCWYSLASKVMPMTIFDHWCCGLSPAHNKAPHSPALTLPTSRMGKQIRKVKMRKPVGSGKDN